MLKLLKTTRMLKERPKQRKPSQNLEHKLQAKCVIKFSQLYPEQRGRLIGYFAEVENKIEGGIKNSLGLVRGVSDLIYFDPSGDTIGIEMKAKTTDHETAHLIEQCEWLLSVPTYGCFCDSFELFFDIVEGRSCGISARVILERLKKVKTKTVKWDEISKF